jgi:hypothetical protein
LIDKDGVMLPSLGHPNDVTMMTIQDYQNRVQSVGNAWPLLFSTRTMLAPFFLEKLFIPFAFVQALLRIIHHYLPLHLLKDLNNIAQPPSAKT